MSLVGTPLVIMHTVAETEDCTCVKLPECGGIVSCSLTCPEHGVDCGPLVKYHTHAMQVDRISVGTHAL